MKEFNDKPQKKILTGKLICDLGIFQTQTGHNRVNIKRDPEKYLRTPSLLRFGRPFLRGFNNINNKNKREILFNKTQ